MIVVDARLVWQSFAAWMLCDPVHGVIKFATSTQAQAVIRRVSNLVLLGGTREQFRILGDEAEAMADAIEIDLERIQDETLAARVEACIDALEVAARAACPSQASGQHRDIAQAHAAAACAHGIYANAWMVAAADKIADLTAQQYERAAQ